MNTTCKKPIAFLFLFLLGFLLAHCSDDGDSDTDNTGDESTLGTTDQSEILADTLCMVCAPKYKACQIPLKKCESDIKAAAAKATEKDLKTLLSEIKGANKCQQVEPDVMKVLPNLKVCLKESSSLPHPYSPPKNSSGSDSSSQMALDCVDSGEDGKSRVLSFSGCGDYVIKHVGLYGVGHDASEVASYGGGKGAKYLLSKLGVLDLGTINRSSSSSATEVTLTNKTTTFSLEQSVIDVNEKAVTVERTYIVQRPSDYDSSKLYPVVFAFHGHGGNAQSWTDMIGDLVETHKFIGVYPQGYKDSEAKDSRGEQAGTSWNLGAEESTADDVIFVSEIISAIAYLSPDAAMRFAIGNSNGAALSNFLASNGNKMFSGIGTTVSGLIETRVGGDTDVTIQASGNTYKYGLSSSAKPLSVVAISGMADPIIPFCGGEAKTGYNMLTAENSIRAWAKKAGCTDHATAEVVLFDGGSTTSIDLSDY